MTALSVHTPGLVHFVCQDFCGITRGRGFSRQRLAGQMARGVGWVPANLGLNPFSDIVENPWGSRGDLVLMPDPASEVFVSMAEPTTSPLHYFLCDIVNLDGSPWEACPRHYLRRQIDALAQRGIRIMASFEHEFMLTDIVRPTPAFSLAGARKEESLCAAIIDALYEANIEPEMCLPEYAPRQYEVTLRPTDALRAADRAVNAREIIHEICRRHGRQITFSPCAPDNTGTNGVHVHISLWSTDGQPLTYDPAKPGRLSTLAASFASGLLKHMPALTALSAPGEVSYQRLRPHSWSAAYTCIGDQNREASVRIAPINRIGGGDPAHQANFEYRPADALASPYLVLGSLLAAGLDGVEHKLPLPPLLNDDPSNLTDSQRAELGALPLPSTLSEALEALKADQTICSGFSTSMLNCYVNVKHSEVEAMRNLDEQEIRRRYSMVY